MPQALLSQAFGLDGWPYTVRGAKVYPPVEGLPASGAAPRYTFFRLPSPFPSLRLSLRPLR